MLRRLTLNHRHHWLVLSLTRSIVYQYFHLYEPELLIQRRRVVFKKKGFVSAGVNHFWCIDQHDKWKYKFGLCLHIGVEPFSGLILWLRVWWNNNNPVLICNYYLNALEDLKSECPTMGQNLKLRAYTNYLYQRCLY